MASRKPTVRIKIGLDDKPAIRQLKQFRSEFKRSATQINSSLELIQKGVSLVGSAFGPVVSGLKAATKAASEFQVATREVASIADSTTFPLEKIEGLTRELAATYGGPAKDQAKALYQAISAGATTSAKAQEILHEANKLSIGGLTSVETAVGSLAAIVNAYGEDVVSFREVSDALSTTVVHGVTTMEELATSIGAVVPAAVAVGVPLDDLLSAIAAITTQGISTSEAVTSLNGVLTALQKQSRKTTDEAERLGVRFDVAALRAKGLAGLLNDVVSSSKLTDESMLRLTGRTEALKSALALTARNGEKMAAVSEAMAKKTGTATRAFKLMDETFKQRVRRLEALWSNAAIALGDYLIKNEDFAELLSDIEEMVATFTAEIKANGPAIRKTVSEFVSGVRTIAGVLKNNREEFGLLLKVLIAAKAAAGVAAIAGGVKGLVGGAAGAGIAGKAVGALKANPAAAAGVAGTAGLAWLMSKLGAFVPKGGARAMVGELQAPRPGQPGYRKPFSDPDVQKSKPGFLVTITDQSYDFSAGSNVTVLEKPGSKSKKGRGGKKGKAPLSEESQLAIVAGALSEMQRQILDDGGAFARAQIEAEHERVKAMNDLARKEVDARRLGNDELADLYGAKRFEIENDLAETSPLLDKQIAAQERHVATVNELGSQLLAATTSGIGNTIAGLTAAIASGEEDLGAAVKRMLGTVISNIGLMLIQMGTAALALQLFSLIPALAPFVGPPGMSATAGAIALGTGIALVAAGSALGSSSSSSGSSGARTRAGGGASVGGAFRAPTSDVPSGFEPAGGGPVSNVINVTFGRGVVFGTPTEIARTIGDMSSTRDRLRLGFQGGGKVAIPTPCFLWPVRFTAATFDFVIYHAGTSETLRFPAATASPATLTENRDYWLSGDASIDDAGGNVDLAIVLQKALNANVNGVTYTVSIDAENLITIAASHDFSIDWTNAATDLDATIFGASAVAATVPPVASSETFGRRATGIWSPGYPPWTDSRDQQPIAGGIARSASGLVRASYFGAMARERELSFDMLDKSKTLQEYGDALDTEGTLEDLWLSAGALGRRLRYYADASDRTSFTTYRIRDPGHPFRRSGVERLHWSAELRLAVVT